MCLTPYTFSQTPIRIFLFLACVSNIGRAVLWNVRGMRCSHKRKGRALRASCVSQHQTPYAGYLFWPWKSAGTLSSLSSTNHVCDLLSFSCRTRLFVQGSIQYNNYVDQDGMKRFNTSIVPSKTLLFYAVCLFNILQRFSICCWRLLMYCFLCFIYRWCNHSLSTSLNAGWGWLLTTTHICMSQVNILYKIVVTMVAKWL